MIYQFLNSDESENDDKKMPSDEFIQDILSEDKIKLDMTFDCTLCNHNFETKDKLNTHLQSTHSSSIVKSSVMSDVNKNDMKNFLECPECHKVFSERKILKRHLKIHSPIKPHACPECEMSFAESSNLSKHMKKHTGELRNVVGKPNLCSVCGKGFKWASFPFSSNYFQYYVANNFKFSLLSSPRQVPYRNT